MYLALHNNFYKNQIVLKYSKTESVYDYKEIEHQYFRQCLMDFNIRGVEITSMADIPCRTGLGSSKLFYSCTFTSFIYTYLGQYVSKYKLAKDACTVEIEKLGQPIGKTRSICGCFRRTKFF